MNRRPSSIAPAMMLTLFSASQVFAHCQVPCGIYGDQRRFEEMLEDTQTIAKAIGEIDTLAGTHDATGHNQLARWVSTKEDHATNIQQIVGQYFLAQRIKPDAANYVEQLKAAHGVIVTAMKCKQGADPATAQALEKAIQDLYRAYEGKEPQVGPVKQDPLVKPDSITIRQTPHADHEHADEHGPHGESHPVEHGHHHAE